MEERILNEYIAIRHVKNFAYFRFRPTLKRIIIGLAVPPAYQPDLDNDFVISKDEKGVQVHVDSLEDVERAEHLLGLSYQRT